MSAEIAKSPDLSTPGPLVLLIEDEVRLRRFLRPSLVAHGYRVIEAATAADGMTMIKQQVPDIVLLDLGLPDLDGVDLTHRIRQWNHVPIVVLSARGQEADKVAALDAGADDYLTKPFGMPELLARIRTALRHGLLQTGVEPESEFRSGPLRIDLGARQVFVEDAEVRLTAIEYRLLAVLVQHAGRVVTHRQLLDAVWGPGHADQTQYLRVYMAHVRRKLEPDPSRPRIFRTEIGVGYRLLTDDPEKPRRRPR
jgi:two-component system, OmpR family, KDP operon response regulator KdpE